MTPVHRPIPSRHGRAEESIYYPRLYAAVGIPMVSHGPESEG